MLSYRALNILCKVLLLFVEIEHITNEVVSSELNSPILLVMQSNGFAKTHAHPQKKQ